MSRRIRLIGMALGLSSMSGVCGVLWAQSPDGRTTGRPGRESLPQPVYRVAQQTQPQGGGQGGAQPPAEPAKVAANTNANLPNAAGGLAPTAEHPLIPALQIAYEAMTNVRTNIKDYSATMIKRERIAGKLNDPEFMFVKVRHEPFSVYIYFLGPEKLRGQEALYVEGKNNGNMLGHGVGLRKVVGTVPLQPTGALAMAGQRYPITEIGVYNLTKRLIEVGEHDKNFGECEVKFFKGAKINQRTATCIQVMHPVPRKEFKFNLARIYVDDEYKIPIRYEAYDWPEKPGGQPLLLEEYTYTDVKLNNGFTDYDFDEHNTQYHFH